MKRFDRCSLRLSHALIDNNILFMDNSAIARLILGNDFDGLFIPNIMPAISRIAGNGYASRTGYIMSCWHAVMFSLAKIKSITKRLPLCAQEN